MSDITNGAVAREFHFTGQDFERIRKLIHERAGISLSVAKQDMVYSRLARRLRATGLRTFAEYLSRLERGDQVELEAFTNSLTTNLTAFFREPHHFPLLAEHVGKLGHRPVALWCSAASTGEEPYSMAMTMVDLFGSFTPPVHILATDLDTSVLQKAREGEYPLERLEKMPDEAVRRFFLKGPGVREGHARVRQELRDMITFRQINLLDESWPMRGPFDAIFCRNVMIYFDKPTQYKVLQKFVPLLRPEGLLFAGHSESFYHAGDLFRSRGKTVYELAPEARLRAHRGA
ncbi:MAG: chemotaxis protein CheR [Sulfuricella sp.]|nr:chemotaxis protein CheR [Sulfuricella sp.]